VKRTIDPRIVHDLLIRVLPTLEVATGMARSKKSAQERQQLVADVRFVIDETAQLAAANDADLAVEDPEYNAALDVHMNGGSP
jgi:hypothetical protein